MQRSQIQAIFGSINAVSRVYGPNSEQMYLRLIDHGSCLENAFGDYKLASTYYLAAMKIGQRYSTLEVDTSPFVFKISAGIDDLPRYAQLQIPKADPARYSGLVTAVGILFAYIFLVLPALIFRRLTMRLVLSKAERRWSQSLHAPTSVPDVLAIHEKLISLALYRGEVERASVLSMRSLEIAESLVELKAV